MRKLAALFWLALTALLLVSACGGGGQPIASTTPPEGPAAPATGKVAYYSLRDGISEIPSLKGLGDAEARKTLPCFRELFLTTTSEPFEPHHRRAE
jgi:hypothetical protein